MNSLSSRFVVNNLEQELKAVKKLWKKVMSALPEEDWEDDNSDVYNVEFEVAHEVRGFCPKIRTVYDNYNFSKDKLDYSVNPFFTGRLWIYKNNELFKQID